MGLLYRLFEKDVIKTFDEVNAKNRKSFVKSNNNNNNKLKDFVIKTVGYINSYGIGRDVIAEPEYDFDEIKRAAETDSYIKISLEKHARLIYKAGYYLKSENESAVEYLNTRFRIMSYATGKPMDILYQEVAEDIVRYSNSFLIKTRVKQVMPGIKAAAIFDNNPIGGYSRIDPSTITIQRDDYGNVLSYTQRTVNGKEKKYKPIDVIHFYIDKESSNAFGTPKIIAALEDVKLLRKLEGNVLAIVHRFAMPIFHWRIGKPQAGFQATDGEIDDAKREIENMSVDGVVITNEKTEIQVLGAQGNAINVSEYLKYFESRVFTALDSSASQMGRGGSKQDADSMEAQSHDYVKYIQKTLSIFIENYIFSELLMEGGYNPILNEDDIVYYKFNEINLDTKIKVENHEMLKYQSNLQSLEEARRNIGYKEEVDEERLYKNLIEVPAQVKINQETSKVQTEGAIEVAKIGAMNRAASGSGTLSNGKKKSQAPNKDATNRNRPTNQNGTRSVKVKESLEFNEKVIRNKKTHKREYKDFYLKIEKFKSNVANTESDIDYIIAVTKDSLLQDMNTLILKACNEGVELAIKDAKRMKIDTTNVVATNISLTTFKDMSEKTIKGVFNDIKNNLDGNREFERVDLVINALEYRFRFLIEYVLPKAKWYSYLKAGERVGIEEAKVDFGDSKDAEKYSDIVRTDFFKLDDIPAFHPFCDCKLTFRDKVVK